jgi:hypothetical protein
MQLNVNFVSILSKYFRGVKFSHQTHAVGSGFAEKNFLRILAGAARIVVTWFSQYTCLKVQNFAIMGQL